MTKRVPRLRSDPEAERFLQRDLSGLDLGNTKIKQFEFAPKSERVNMRLPKPLLDSVKARAKREGMPYQRYIRRALEHAVLSRKS
jgi:predicted DNA binding CopG/RHH family protein